MQVKEVVDEKIISTQQIKQTIDIPTLQTQSNLSFILIGLGIGLVLIVIYLIKRKKKIIKNQIAIVGQRNAGKTQLFINWNSGKSIETVPSIRNNSVRRQINSRLYKVTDYMGDNLSKEQVLSELDRFHTIIQVVDGCDSKKLGDAALFIYRLMINRKYQNGGCNFVLFFNKNDLNGFYGQAKLTKRIQDEIQTIKYSRKSQSEQNENEQDYLKKSKVRFELAKNNIRIAVGSSKSNIKDLQMVLDELI